MAELVKPWNDGGILTATYTGSGDGSAVFTSDINEGIDREMVVTYVDNEKKVSVEQVVKQVGLREVFNASDGAFALKDGGTFNVIKNGLQ
jgi:hypothetical protein